MKTLINKKMSLVLVIAFILSIIQFNSLTAFASTSSDFTIVGGVLTKYNGRGRVVVIPDGVKSIGECAFKSTNVTNVTIPNSVTSIGEYAFCSCTNLTNISIPDSVTELGNDAFINCTNLTSISIPDGITNIGFQEFAGCANLTNINIPNTVTNIWNGAFDDCSKLANINIPDGVTHIGAKAFEGTPWLNNYPNDFVIAGDKILVKYKGNQNDVVIPSGVTSISGEAFYYCTNLISVTIPKSITNIDNCAFWHTIQPNPKELYFRTENFDITIHGETGSCAETYAKAENIPFKSINVNNNTVSNATIKSSNVVRLGGKDRYETAVDISKEGWTQSDNVILTTGENYPDALVGTCFAYLKNAPVLITPSGNIDGNINAEIARLQVKNVYIIGSNSTISQSVDNELKQKYNVVRIGGSGLYDTAVNVGDEIRKLKQFDTVVIAPQGDFPDALAIAPFSAINIMPILFSDKDSLRADTMASIQKWGVKNVIIVGGTGVISNDIDSKLKSIGINVTRLAGRDRYDTALEIIKHYSPIEGYKNISIATGESYQDALTGASLAAKNNMPLVLVNKDNIKNNISEYINKDKIDKAYIFGGTGVVSNNIVSQ